VSGKSNHFYTGVSLEKPVVEYLDDLSNRMGMSRSWVLNTIVYEYAKLIENKKLMPQRSIEVVVGK
jgi:metal-responsive CopG/Arc/MetJ family transcriptional regulator